MEENADQEMHYQQILDEADDGYIGRNFDLANRKVQFNYWFELDLILKFLEVDKLLFFSMLYLYILLIFIN